MTTLDDISPSNESIFSTNISNSMFESKSKFDAFTDSFFLVIYLIIFVVGLIANFIVIYFVMFYTRIQTITNKLITNLSIADLFVIVICVPVTASRYVSNEWLFGELICKSSGFIQGE